MKTFRAFLFLPMWLATVVAIKLTWGKAPMADEFLAATKGWVFGYFAATAVWASLIFMVAGLATLIGSRL